MKVIKYFVFLITLYTLYQCGNSNIRAEYREDNCKCSESILVSSKIDDRIEEGFGEIYGYVFIDGDTNSGILSFVSEPKLYLLDTNFCIDIDGHYKLKLPIGKYKVLVEAKQRYPILSKIDLQNKESIHIDFYLNGKWR